MLDVRGSDSARLDNTLEFMTMSGMDLPLAVDDDHSGTVAAHPDYEPGKRAFYQYYATMMEPGTVRHPSSSPMVISWALSWTETVCVRPGTM